MVTGPSERPRLPAESAPAGMHGDRPELPRAPGLLQVGLGLRKGWACGRRSWQRPAFSVLCSSLTLESSWLKIAKD